VKRAFVSTATVTLLLGPIASLCLSSCTEAPTGAAHDASVPDRNPPPLPKGAFCGLPGSVVWTAQGPAVVPGGPPSSPELLWLTLPEGFCAHYFARVPDVRQLRFAPGGELFATSPTTPTTGGNYTEGLGNIVVLADDNRDGLADGTSVFFTGMQSSQGVMFAGGAFYYQDGPAIRSVPYHSGDRQPSATPQDVTTITAPQDGLHWTKVMDIAQDGTIFITNGGSQGDQCIAGNPARGAIFSLNPDGSTTLVAKGFRNPVALRCEKNHNVCLAAELALDYSEDHGGREKLVPIRPGDDWGYPCCATKDLPYAGVTYAGGGTPNCSGVAAEGDSFVIGHTPFGLDFEPGKWPQPWGGRVYVTLHGAAGSWTGARVVAIPLDAAGLPMAATELGSGGPSPDSMLQFASGWDDNARDHGRPAPVTFAPDGRMFLGDDHDGVIVWIAPITLMQP
jgi:glucose/arabinose dehydrogenase